MKHNSRPNKISFVGNVTQYGFVANYINKEVFDNDFLHIKLQGVLKSKKGNEIEIMSIDRNDRMMILENNITNNLFKSLPNIKPYQLCEFIIDYKNDTLINDNIISGYFNKEFYINQIKPLDYIYDKSEINKLFLEYKIIQEHKKSR